MSLVLGLDTGGTFTDAALLDTHSRTVLATAKALTTRTDLSVGVGRAIEAVLAAWDGDVQAISRVTLSTTLATNAVVEGVGGRCALILIGFDKGVLSRAGLGAAIGRDPVLQIAGGHKPDGHEQAALDITGLKAALAGLAGQVSSFAVAGHFATRNPGHETAVRDLLTKAAGLPVTCSHELSDALGGPRRALTTLLNARLISLLDRLIKATCVQMIKLGLGGELMVVKGDGSLLQADYARMRPVETVLSGPAASLAGAAFLAGLKDVMVADIGGTTTDIARLRGGVVQTCADGAMVGGWRTNVEAVHIRTSGLGGDSAVSVGSRDLSGIVVLGPRRAVPLSLLSVQQPQIKEVLRTQAEQAIVQATDGRFIQAMVTAEAIPDWLTRSEKKLLATLTRAGVAALADIATTQVALGAAFRLIERGLVMLSCFTPTDAVHVLGRFDGFDGDAAELGAELLARQKSGAGKRLAKDGREAAQMVIDALTSQSAIALMDAALADDRNYRAAEGRNYRTAEGRPADDRNYRPAEGRNYRTAEGRTAEGRPANDRPAETGTKKAATGQIKGGQMKHAQMKTRPDQDEYLVSSSAVLRGALTDMQDRADNGTSPASQAAARIALQLSLPLVALGAPAGTYYPAIARRLDTDLIVPDHAGVAGAVGAAAAAVRQRVVVLITQPSDGVFCVHLPSGPQDVNSREEALTLARTAAETGAKARAKAAGGAGELVVSLSEAIDDVPAGADKTLFLQAVITAEATPK